MRRCNKLGSRQHQNTLFLLSWFRFPDDFLDFFLSPTGYTKTKFDKIFLFFQLFFRCWRYPHFLPNPKFNSSSMLQSLKFMINSFMIIYLIISIIVPGILSGIHSRGLVWHLVHRYIRSQLSNDHLIPLALLPQPHNLCFQHLYLLNQVHILVAPHFL